MCVCFCRRRSFLLLDTTEAFHTKGKVLSVKPGAGLSQPGVESRGGNDKELWVYSQPHSNAIEKQIIIKPLNRARHIL